MTASVFRSTGAIDTAAAMACGWTMNGDVFGRIIEPLWKIEKIS
jgi:hypothetical protein